MGESVNKIDEGFYICGVQALQPSSAGSKLQELGVRCVLNVAGSDLYRTNLYGEESRLEEALEEFEVKVIGAIDVPGCSICEHFGEIADFIEAGRAKGGIIVHCAAGVSRATTSCCAYLMIKEHWSLEAAYARIRGVRSVCEPNAGFWRQLRELEESLITQGVQLKHLPSDYEFPEQPEREGAEETKEKRMADTWAKIRALDRDAQTGPSEALRVHLMAIAVPIDGFAPERLANLLSMESSGGITWEQVVAQEGRVHIRASGRAPLDGESLRAHLNRNPLVKSVALEGESAASDEGA